MRMINFHQCFVTFSKSCSLFGLQILPWVKDEGRFALISSIFVRIFFLGLCKITLIWIFVDFLFFSVFHRHESHLQQDLNQPTFKIRSENKAISKIRYKTRWKASTAVRRDQQKKKTFSTKKHSCAKLWREKSYIRKVHELGVDV